MGGVQATTAPWIGAAFPNPRQGPVQARPALPPEARGGRAGRGAPQVKFTFPALPETGPLTLPVPFAEIRPAGHDPMRGDIGNLDRPELLVHGRILDHSPAAGRRPDSVAPCSRRTGRGRPEASIRPRCRAHVPWLMVHLVIK